jgi:adenosylmethionine-8-amino-7-oxononanoate aminotransferase
VVPDILVGGKGLAGGYMPMGMIAVRENLVEQCEAKGADFMFYTYSSHPTACAVAERVLEIMEREQLVERAAAIGARLGAQLKEELSGHPMVGDIRGAGMFWGVEMVRDRASRTPYPPAMKVASRVVAAGLKRGLFVYPATGMARPGGDAVMVTPPFVIGADEIDYIVSRLRATLDDVHPNLR